MKYLSIDIEATGLEPHDLIIELALVPFDTETESLDTNLSRHFYIQCPSFETLKPKLNPWVIEHNQALIEMAHNQGKSLDQVKKELIQYLESAEVENYFNNEKITIFGKSLNAIDLPFLNRDLGDDFIKKYFNHKVLDMSSVAFSLIDLGLLPKGTDSSTQLMNYFQMGEVAHTALEDAMNMATLYISILKKFS